MRKIRYSGYRFPPEIIHQAIRLYLRFTLSFRDVEDLLAERRLGNRSKGQNPIGVLTPVTASRK
jgi:transposase-like protein